MRIIIHVCGLATLGVLAGCSRAADLSSSEGAAGPWPRGVACTMQAVVGLSVAVFDSVTGEPLPSGVTVVAREGAFADSARAAFPPSTFALLFERAGSYTVTVTHPAYRTWRRDDVRITAGLCHVTPIQLRVDLQR